MNTYRRNAIIVGILFIACTVFSIISMSMTNSFLDATDYIAKLAANQHQAVTAALFELIWAATGLSIAIGL
jgi:multisubunit Na+/H+ antiporter MnhB subunit